MLKKGSIDARLVKIKLSLVVAKKPPLLRLIVRELQLRMPCVLPDVSYAAVTEGLVVSQSGDMLVEDLAREGEGRAREGVRRAREGRGSERACAHLVVQSIDLRTAGAVHSACEAQRSIRALSGRSPSMKINGIEWSRAINVRSGENQDSVHQGARGLMTVRALGGQ